MKCPQCNNLIVFVEEGAAKWGKNQYQQTYVRVDDTKSSKKRFVYPDGATRPPCPIEAPNDIQSDYNEACSILEKSPKASAAMARRVLQRILRDPGGFADKNLFTEIQNAIDSGKLPDELCEQLDAVRQIGNWAAHPELHEGNLIADVEPDEAEWTLDVVESCVHHFFVQPARRRAKLDALDAKKAAAKAAKST